MKPIQAAQQWLLRDRKPIKASLWALLASALPSSTPNVGHQRVSVAAVANTTTPTEVFQLYKPPLAPIDTTTDPANDFAGASCSSVLFQYDFANSYGTPYVGPYTPPSVSCKWNTVYFHLYTTSKGRQYDRLAFIFLDDTELWRTSTAEPTTNGIYFTYTKDLTQFTALLNSTGTLIMDLGNILTDTLTGTFNVTLTAYYFNLDLPHRQKPADVIEPVSRRIGFTGQPSEFVLPDQNATSLVTVPQHIEKAVLSIIASGNSEEEFWYTNVPTSLSNVFPNSTLYGHSPYREVQVYVDGVLVAAVMPWATIYTGGINPGLWRPVVSPFAYDLWEAEVDVTPWVFGKSQANITIQVQGLEDDGKGSLQLGGGIGENWYVSGRTFFWTDPEANVKVSEYSLSIPAPTIEYQFSNTGSGDDQIVSFTLQVERQISISRVSHYGNITWVQTQQYSESSTLLDYGNNQTLTTTTNGYEELLKTAADGTSSVLQIRNWTWPFYVDSAYVSYPDQSFLIYGEVDRSYSYKGPENVLLTDNSILALDHFSDDSGLWTSQTIHSISDSSTYFSAATNSGKNSSISGNDRQTFDYTLTGRSGPSNRVVETYHRDVSTVYPVVVGDHETINGVVTKDIDTAGALVKVQTASQNICVESLHTGGKKGRKCPDRVL